MPITRSRFLRPRKKIGLESVAAATSATAVLARCRTRDFPYRPAGPTRTPAIGVASDPQRWWMHDRPGCAPGQLDDRVANARIDHAAEDKDAGHHRVSRPPRARPTALRLARRAGVSYDLRAAPAWDDLRASAGARSQPVRLLHPC